MAIHTEATSSPSAALPSALTEKALAEIAARVRPLQTGLVVVLRDGTIAWHDDGALPIVTRYLVPAFRHALASVDTWAEIQRTLKASPTGCTWQGPGGLVAAVWPLVEKRQPSAYLALVACGNEFSQHNEEVQSCCGRLSIDSTWLSQQAARLRLVDEPQMAGHLQVLSLVAADQLRLAGLAGELAAMSEQLSNSYEELSLIYHLSTGVRVNRGPTDFLRQACVDVMDVLAVESMGFALKHNANAPTQAALYGQPKLTSDQVDRMTQCLFNKLRTHPHPLLVNNLNDSDEFRWLAPFAGRLIAVPLQRQDEVLGCFFGLDKPTDFDSMDAKLLNSIGNESAIYLENALLYDDVHGLMMGVLHSLTSAVDAKDAYTCGHSERVALLSRELGRRIGMSETQVERIYIAGLLHDVGKIGVPEAVLQKCGRLTAEEFVQMKKHPEIGARILSDIKQMEDIIPGVLYHHERYDGRGYPRGLIGKHIPLMGRIICLADSFDAMTSNRTYRQAMSLEHAIDEIRRSRGTQFDPDLAESFLDIGPDRLRSLLQSHRDQTARTL